MEKPKCRCRVREPVFCQCHSSTGKFIVNRSLCPFRDCPCVPTAFMKPCGELLKCQRVFLWGFQDPLCPDFTVRTIGLRAGQRPLQPTLGITRHRHNIRFPDTLLGGFNKVQAIAVQRICHNICKGQNPLLIALKKHLSRILGFAPKIQILRHLTCFARVRIPLLKPLFREKHACIHQRIPLARRIPLQVSL